MKIYLKLTCLVVCAAILGGCAYGFVGREGQLYHSGLYAELGRDIRARYPAGKPMPLETHYYLCQSYSGVKNYGELFPCVRGLRDRIAKGENPKAGAMFFGDIRPWTNMFLAGAYLDLGRFDEAIAEAQAIRRIYLKYVHQAPHIFSHAYVGLAYALSGREKEARASLAELQKYADPSPFNNLASDTFSALARIHFALGDYETALKDLKHAEGGVAADRFIDLISGASLVGESAFVQSMLPWQFMLNKALLETGQIDKARAGYDALLAHPALPSAGEIYWTLLSDRARIHSGDGQHDKAIELLYKAVEVIEKQRTSIHSEASKIGFAGNKQAVYARLVSELTTSGKNKRAFEVVERAKARALVDMLASRQSFAADINSETTAELIRELDQLERQSIQLASLSKNQTRTRNTRLEQTRKTLRATSPELASLVSVAGVGAGSIQSRLTADEVLLEYYGHGDDLYAYVVTNNDVKGTRLNGKGLADQVKGLRSAIQTVDSNHHMKLTRAMYKRLIQPVINQLTGKKLTVVPHGALHYLPFAALHDGTGYLFERYKLRILPSASVLQFLEKKNQSTAGLLALGNPDLGNPAMDLPGAEEETRVINLGWRGSRVLLRKQASEANFKKYAPAFKYLHLASHGEFNSDAPLKSRMLLASGAGEDGNLTVDELYQLRLNADLVTLSACETGLGDIKSGDDVIGLTRGFLYAGAKSIVASLWPVSDAATAFLMKRFYANLKSGSKTAALQKALAATKKAFPHPIYWSAFQITGAG
jgi:CHAT domain-containing protein